MRLPGERATLKLLLRLSVEPDRVMQVSRRWSRICVATGLALIAAMAWWNKDLNDAAYIILSFAGGVLLAVGYSKYSESILYRRMAPYLKRELLEERAK